MDLDNSDHPLFKQRSIAYPNVVRKIYIVFILAKALYIVRPNVLSYKCVSIGASDKCEVSFEYLMEDRRRESRRDNNGSKTSLFGTARWVCEG